MNRDEAGDASVAAGGDPVTDRRRRWSGAALIEALETTAAHFEPHVAAINALNVFPVPDGDTGTNMFLTLQAAVREAQKLSHTAATRAEAILESAARGALMGARGNSGVILYQILAGIAEGSRGADVLDGAHLAAGLRRAADLAYRAVVEPVEGTMLTVTRAAADAAERAAQGNGSLAGVLNAAVEGAERALQQTPKLLEILRQAGVVDAGGRGLVVLFTGLQRFVEGTTLTVSTTETVPLSSPLASSMPFLDQIDTLHGCDPFGYCTNFLLTGTELPVDEIRQRMTELGTSAVVVGDSTMLKVHVHSEHPGTILEVALNYGDLEQVRIDNMAKQTQHLLEERAASHVQPAPATPIGIVAVANGAGLTAVLQGMGAAAVVPGGPALNPSTEDLLRAIESLPQREVILLPNDPNVIPTAQQAAQLSQHQVGVVPSRSIPEGISALAAFNFDATLDENIEAMTQALDFVQSLALTRASRDVEIHGVQARQGQFVGMRGGQLAAAGEDPVQVVLTLIGDADPDDAELVTLFVGETAAPDLGEQVAAAIEAAHPHLAVEVAPGDQPHYDLLIALE